MSAPHSPPPPGRAAPRSRLRRQNGQRGVYALEWAFIFPVFFALLYGIICYGLTFLVRESMQYAVEEGARAALRYAPSWSARETAVRATVADALSWLPAAIAPSAAANAGNLEFAVCPIPAVPGAAMTCQDSDDAPVCTPTAPCMVRVRYTIRDYQANAIAPPLPGFGLVLPDNLQATASILMDRRML